MGLWNRIVTAGVRGYFRRRVIDDPVIPLAFRDLEGIRRILLVSNTAIGDTLLSTPAVRAVKKSFPDRLVGLVCHVRCEPLVRYNPFVDRLHRFRSKFYGMRSLVAELRRERYDMAVILHGNDPESVPLCYAAGVRTIVGSGSSRFRFLTSDPAPPLAPYDHAIERRLAYVRMFGARPAGVHMDLVVPSEVYRSARKELEQRFGEGAWPVVAFHPAGSGSYKWWPAERFAELADRLADRFGASILVVCGTEEAELGESIVRATRAPALATAGRYDLLEVAGLLRWCNLMVTTDSGPMHMALALEVPTLALIGADHPARIGPYGVAGAEVIYKKEAVCDEPDCRKHRCPENVCLRAVTVDDVWERIVRRFAPALEGEPPGFPEEDGT